MSSSRPSQSKLHPNSEESGSSFDNSNSVRLSSGTASGENQPRCDRVTTAYLHHMQKGKFVQPFGCLLALDEKTFRVIAYSQNASEMLTMVSHAVPSIGDHPALAIGTDIRTIFTALSVAALQKALAVPEVSLLNPILVHCMTSENPFYEIVHRVTGSLIIDFEPVKPHEGDGFKFHEDDHGEVIAGVAKPGLEPYLDLHYPATDILQELLIVSTCHLQYMNSIASLVMAVVVNDHEDGDGSDVAQPQKRKRHWGLVVCHNTNPRFVPFPLGYCEFLAQVFAIHVNKELELEYQIVEKNILRTQTLLCNMLMRDAPFGIVSQSTNIMDLVRCDGATLLYRDKVWRLGVAPSESRIRELALWPSKCHKDSTGLSTDRLSNAGFPRVAALEIRWGGVKHEPGGRDDPTKMSPRSSFKAFLKL
ncbi:Phytochrome type A [Arachis hypogaea]|nr:Phytochrome type A [Arachis hypogaea]